MAKFTVAKVEGKWQVKSKDTGEVSFPEKNSRDSARAMKASMEPAKAQKASKPKAKKKATKKATTKARTSKPKEKVKQVAVANDEKVKCITAGNYAANLARATELKAKLVKHYQKTGGFPSHRFIINVWGYNMSLKAIIRHKKNIKIQLGLKEDAVVETTSELPRPTKKETN